MDYDTRLAQPARSLLIGAPSGEATFFDGPVRTRGRIRRVVFTPPDRQVIAQSAPGRIRVVTCMFDRDRCERVFGSFDKLSRAQLVDCLDVHSALLPALSSRLMTEALHPGCISAAVADSLGQALLVEWSHAILSRAPAGRQRARLLPRHFTVIDEHLAATGETPGRFRSANRPALPRRTN